MRLANWIRLIVINKTLVTDAYSRPDTRAVATVHLTDRFAYVFRTFITVSVTVVTLASLWRYARAKNAGSVALRQAGETIVLLLVIIQAFADIRRHAKTVFAFAITNRLAHERGEVSTFLVTGTTRADMRFVAISVISFAFLVTDGTTSESV